MIRLLWVGRLTREKGADDLMDLILGMNSVKPEKKIVWYIVGTGEMEERLKALAFKYKNVKYLGYLSKTELASIYQKCDLFLSTSKFESLPYTFIEAQTYGLPIISYNISGCNEIVINGLNGYLVASIEEIKEKIVYLVKYKNKLIKRDLVRNNIKKLIDNQEIYKKLYELLQ